MHCRWIAVVALAGCSTDGVLDGICNGHVQAGTPMAATVLTKTSPNRDATIDAYALVDREDRTSAFMGVYRNNAPSMLTLFATGPGAGFLKLQLDGDTQWTWFSLSIGHDADQSCMYTYASDPP